MTNDEPQEQQRYEYSSEPIDKAAFTAKFDETYTQIAPLYNFFVKICAPWRTWITSVIPYIRGPRVLEVSFGTGYLLTQIAAAAEYEVHGVEYNKALLEMAREALEKQGLDAKLVKGNVQDLPYPNNHFDTVICTMAFTGYPDGQLAMKELIRVLRDNGVLLIVDITYPNDKGNCLGMSMTKLWKAAGDVIRNMGKLFDDLNLEYTDEEIGGFGSVHLYVVTKR